MTLYDLNKITVAAMPKLTGAEIEKSKEFIISWAKESGFQYAMLLNNEDDVKYYTIFNLTNKNNSSYENFANELIECFNSIGIIKSINYGNDDTTIEIWAMYKDVPRLYHLFNYDVGVIEIG